DSLPSSPTYGSSGLGWPAALPMPSASSVLLRPTAGSSTGGEPSNTQQTSSPAFTPHSSPPPASYGQHHHTPYQSHYNNHNQYQAPHRSISNTGYSQPTSPIAISAVHKGWVHHSAAMSHQHPNHPHHPHPPPHPHQTHMAGSMSTNSCAPTPPAGGIVGPSSLPLTVGSGSHGSFPNQNNGNNSVNPNGAGGSYGSLSSSMTSIAATGRTIGQRVLAERMRIEAALLKNSQSLSTTPPGRSFFRKE
ncbi:hypothetical protein BGZ73_000809, partial [Actinomortierella ambigua]